MVQALPETQNLPLRAEPHTPRRVIPETSFQSERVEAALVVEIPASVLWTSFPSPLRPFPAFRQAVSFVKEDPSLGDDQGGGFFELFDFQQRSGWTLFG